MKVNPQIGIDAEGKICKYMKSIISPQILSGVHFPFLIAHLQSIVSSNDVLEPRIHLPPAPHPTHKALTNRYRWSASRAREVLE